MQQPTLFFHQWQNFFACRSLEKPDLDNKLRCQKLASYLYCIKKSACDIVGTFRCPPQWFGALNSDSAPGEFCPPCHSSLRPCDTLTSTFFNSTFASERPQVLTRWRRTCFLFRAPSNLVTPLLTYICCYSFSHAAIWFNLNQGH